jgi:hypothetical protein
MAADDFAELFVNGVRVGSFGSVENMMTATEAQNTPTTYDIMPLLKQGNNVITVRAQNAMWAEWDVRHTYVDNPAGLVLGVAIGFVD